MRYIFANWFARQPCAVDCFKNTLLLKVEGAQGYSHYLDQEKLFGTNFIKICPLVKVRIWSEVRDISLISTNFEQYAGSIPNVSGHCALLKSCLIPLNDRMQNLSPIRALLLATQWAWRNLCRPALVLQSPMGRPPAGLPQWAANTTRSTEGAVHQAALRHQYLNLLGRVWKAKTQFIDFLLYL